MTGEGELQILQTHLRVCQRLEAGLRTVLLRIDGLFPADRDQIENLDDDRHVDVLAFLKTFEQFEDALGRTLKVIALMMSFGKAERLAPRDVANRALSLGIIEDGRAWANAVRTRNELAHEYPVEPDKQADQVNKAWQSSETLFRTAQEIRVFVTRERLLDDLI